jgi:two-component system NarL family sensor kinase
MRLSRPRLVLLAAAGLIPPLLLYAHASHPEQAVELPLVTAAMTLVAALLFIRIASLAETLAEQATVNRHLLDVTVSAVERERAKIASNLQEGPIQRLTGVGLTAELANRRLRRGRADQASDLLDRLGHEVAVEIAGLREVMSALTPPVLSEVGLGKALRAYIEEFEERTGVHATGTFDAAIMLGRDQRIVLYRIAQEALDNVARHSGAGNVRVTLRTDGESARLTVVDDGRGFDPADAGELLQQRSLGLIGMRHRAELVAGTFEITSSPGEGTTVVATVPYPPEP